jgi:hypothetical protein
MRKPVIGMRIVMRPPGCSTGKIPVVSGAGYEGYSCRGAWIMIRSLVPKDSNMYNRLFALWVVTLFGFLAISCQSPNRHTEFVSLPQQTGSRIARKVPVEQFPHLAQLEEPREKKRAPVKRTAPEPRERTDQPVEEETPPPERFR